MKVKNVYVVCASVTLDPLLKPLVYVHKIRYNVAWQTNKGWLIARFVKIGPFEEQPTARNILFAMTTYGRRN